MPLALKHQMGATQASAGLLPGSSEGLPLLSWMRHLCGGSGWQQGWGAAWQQLLCQGGLAAPTGTLSPLRLSWPHQPLWPRQSLLGSGLPARPGRGGTWPLAPACAWHCLPSCPTPAAPQHPLLSLSAAISHVSGSLGDLLHFFSFNLEMQFPPQNILFPVNNISLVRLQQKSLSSRVAGALSPGEPHPSRPRVGSRHPALADG